MMRSPKEYVRWLLVLLLALAAQGGVALDDPPFQKNASCDYLIVAPNDPGILEQFVRFAEWKTTRGLRARVCRTDSIAVACQGKDLQEKIRTCIRHAHDSLGVTWVLLAGDLRHVPARAAQAGKTGIMYGNDTIWTDTYYACLDGTWDENQDGVYGNDPVEPKYDITYAFDSTGAYVIDRVVATVNGLDLDPDVYVGRLPVSNAVEARIVVDKTIAYATQAKQTTNACRALLFGPTMFHRSVDPSTGSFLSDAAQWLHTRVKPLLPSMEIVQEIYEDSIDARGVLVSARNSLTQGRLNAALSLGPNIVVFKAHGCPIHILISSSDVVQGVPFSMQAVRETAAPTYANIISSSCSNMMMPAPDTVCFAKSFLVHPDGGAVSYGGASYGEGDSIGSRIVEGVLRTLRNGGATRIAQAQAVVVAGSVGDRVSHTTQGDSWDDYRSTLFMRQYWGDPELECWTKPLTVGDSVALTVAGTGAGYRVTTTPAIDSVLVCLYKPGAVFQRGYTKAGVVDFEGVDSSVTGILVTATRHDWLPGHVTFDAATYPVGVVRRTVAAPTLRPFTVRVRGTTLSIDNHAHKPLDVWVFDARGRLCNSNHFTGAGRIDGLPPGLYIVRLSQTGVIVTQSVMVCR